MTWRIGGNSFGLINKTIDNDRSVIIRNTASGGDIILEMGSNGETTKFNLRNDQVTNNILYTVGEEGETTTQNAHINTTTVTTYNTDGNQGYSAAALIGGIVGRDCNGSARIDTLPTAANVVSAITNCIGGSSFTCSIRNIGTNHLLTLDDSGTNITLKDVKTIPNGTTSRWLFIVTNVGSPSIDGYLVNKTTLSDDTYVSTRSFDLTGGYGIGAPATPTNFATYRANNGTGVSDAWTISLWARQLDSSPSQSQLIINTLQNPLSGNINTIVIQHMNPQRLKFAYGSALNGLSFLGQNDTFTYGYWHHIMVTYDGGTTGSDPGGANDYYSRFKIFIDGVLQTTANTFIGNGVSSGFPADNFILGSGPITSSLDSFTGRLDEISLFGYDAQADIAAIYNGGNTRNLLTLSTPPENWWKIEPSDTFPVITDSVGGVNITLTDLVAGDYSVDVPPGGSSLINEYSLNFTANDQYYRKLSLPGTFPLSRSTSGSGDPWSTSHWYRRTVDMSGGTAPFLFGATTNHAVFMGSESILNSISNNSPYIFMGTVFGSPSGLLVLTTDTQDLIGLNVWSHVLVTYDGGVTGGTNSGFPVYGSRFKIFVNGVICPFTAAGTGDGLYGPLPFADFSIGKPWMAVANPDSGNLDEVAIFDADVSGDVSNIYNGGYPDILTNLTTPPLHWWRFTQTDKNNYPTLVDQIGSIDLSGTNLSGTNITSVVAP